jgi:uncharacterized membrane protein HdeD (DUF308 family)
LSGIVEATFSVVNRKTMTLWGWSLASGIVSFVFGAMLLVNPFTSMVVLALCIGLAILFRSIGGIILSINLKKYGAPRWGYLLTLSILGVLMSLFLMSDPILMWVAITKLAAITLFVAGFVSIGLFIFLRKTGRKEEDVDVSVLQIS